MSTLFVLKTFCTEKYKPKITEIHGKVMKKFVWNGFLRFSAISSIVIAMATTAQTIELKQMNAEDVNVVALISCILCWIVLLFYDMFLICFLNKTVIKSQYDLNSVKSAFGEEDFSAFMFLGKNMRTRDKFAMLNFPIFIGRRLVFAAVPAILTNYQSLQLICLVFSN